VREIEESPTTVTTAPQETLIGRIDEARAARQPDLRWHKKA
jgi:glycine dehydrogenase subunit 2